MYRTALSIILMGLLCLFSVHVGGSYAAAVTMYTVEKGDTLWAISRRYGVELSALMQLNGLRANSILQIGQGLRIPASGGDSPEFDGTTDDTTVYQIKAGDNLWRLAQARGISVNALLAANPGINPSRLQIGQIIRLPELNSDTSMTVSSLTGSRYSTAWYDWPVKGSITSRFGSRSNGFHHGLDIAANTGTYVRVAAAGRVSYAGWMNIYGYTVLVTHPDGRQTLYGHNSKLLVSQGDIVRRGQLVAQVGSTGRSTGPHLHFEVRVNGQAQNPLSFLPPQ